MLAGHNAKFGARLTSRVIVGREMVTEPVDMQDVMVMKVRVKIMVKVCQRVISGRGTEGALSMSWSVLVIVVSVLVVDIPLHLLSS